MSTDVSVTVANFGNRGRGTEYAGAVDAPENVPAGTSRLNSRLGQVDKWAVTHQTERRKPEPLLYTTAQLQGRSRIYLRRRRDKVRFAAHVGGAAGLVGLSLWWVIPLHSFAGPVLLTLAPGHGVHVGDLPTVPFLLVAAWSAVMAVRMLEISGPKLHRSH